MKIVSSHHANESEKELSCQCCGKKIVDIENGMPLISYKDLYKKGNIPIPNFGWMCSQDCAERFEKENDIKFARTEDGKIDYYDGSLE
jgi:hypothetical protein